MIRARFIAKGWVRPPKDMKEEQKRKFFPRADYITITIDPEAKNADVYVKKRLEELKYEYQEVKYELI